MNDYARHQIATVLEEMANSIRNGYESCVIEEEGDGYGVRLNNSLSTPFLKIMNVEEGYDKSVFNEALYELTKAGAGYSPRWYLGEADYWLDYNNENASWREEREIKITPEIMARFAQQLQDSDGATDAIGEQMREEMEYFIEENANIIEYEEE